MRRALRWLFPVFAMLLGVAIGTALYAWVITAVLG